MTEVLNGCHVFKNVLKVHCKSCNMKTCPGIVAGLEPRLRCGRDDVLVHGVLVEAHRLLRSRLHHVQRRPQRVKLPEVLGHLSILDLRMPMKIENPN